MDGHTGNVSTGRARIHKGEASCCKKHARPPNPWVYVTAVLCLLLCAGGAAQCG